MLSFWWMNSCFSGFPFLSGIYSSFFYWVGLLKFWDVIFNLITSWIEAKVLVVVGRVDSLKIVLQLFPWPELRTFGTWEEEWNINRRNSSEFSNILNLPEDVNVINIPADLPVLRLTTFLVHLSGNFGLACTRAPGLYLFIMTAYSNHVKINEDY